jgi:hypothetical protein
MPCWRMHRANARSAWVWSPPPGLVVLVALPAPPRLATPLGLPPPQPATASARASSSPGSSPILMRLIAVLLLGGRPGLGARATSVPPCPSGTCAPRRAGCGAPGAGVPTGRLHAGNGGCYRAVTPGSGIPGEQRPGAGHRHGQPQPRRSARLAATSGRRRLEDRRHHDPVQRQRLHPKRQADRHPHPVRPAADRRASSGLRGTVTSQARRRWPRAGHIDVRVAPLLGFAGAAWPRSTAAAFRVRKHRGRAVQTV